MSVFDKIEKIQFEDDVIEEEVSEVEAEVEEEIEIIIEPEPEVSVRKVETIEERIAEYEDTYSRYVANGDAEKTREAVKNYTDIITPWTYEKFQSIRQEAYQKTKEKIRLKEIASGKIRPVPKFHHCTFETETLTDKFAKKLNTIKSFIKKGI